MAVNNSSYTTVGKPKSGGAIYSAEIGTTLPTSVSAELAQDFENVGFISEDGLVNSNVPESDSIKAWGGDVVLPIQTERPDTFKFTMLEALNPAALKVAYGTGNVSGTLENGITVTANSDQIPERSWVIDMVMRNGALKRIVIPKASVTGLDDITYKDDEAVGYGVTLTATPDDAGNTHYEYIKAASSTDNNTGD